MARVHVASFAPKQSEGENDATRDTKNYLPDKSHVIIIIINTQGQILQIVKNVFHNKRLFNMKSCGGLQIPFTAPTLPFGLRKGAF